MLVVIAIVALANAAEWVDPDLWIPFVCIIAVMGIGTRGGVLDSLGFVLIESAVVLVLGVATFSGSRDFVWAASVAVSILAVGKIALLEMARGDAPKAAPTSRPTPAPGPETVVTEHSEVRTRTSDDDEPSQPLGTISVEDAERKPEPPPEPRPKKKRDRDDPTPVKNRLST
jgi:hypothetical protein